MVSRIDALMYSIGVGVSINLVGCLIGYLIINVFK